MLCAHHGSFALFGVITEHSFIFVFTIENTSCSQRFGVQ